MAVIFLYLKLKDHLTRGAQRAFSCGLHHVWGPWKGHDANITHTEKSVPTRTELLSSHPEETLRSLMKSLWKDSFLLEVGHWVIFTLEGAWVWVGVPPDLSPLTRVGHAPGPSPWVGHTTPGFSPKGESNLLAPFFLLIPFWNHFIWGLFCLE